MNIRYQRMDVIRVWKRIGETPLQALSRTRKEYDIPEDIVGCYTCRLDPMAQGAMTMLFNDMVNEKTQKKFNSSSKTYRFQAILGISTTSYDPLGRIQNIRQVTAEEAKQFMIKICELGGEIEQRLPPCSAYRYKGKPLWLHAINGTLPDTLPTKRVHVYSVHALQPHPTIVSLEKYRSAALSDISDVKGLNPDANFQYDDIISDWCELREGQPLNYVYRVCLEANVGSGTFVRSLVHDTAQELGIPAHAFRITRTQTFEAEADLNP